ncbi:MAG: transglutaminase domain-containing protein [Candidatus Krumholzibacteriota bacterium]|nr:transglutaminase domain-containing protein [Candidatus Krumholzibacteriota bacterium]
MRKFSVSILVLISILAFTLLPGCRSEMGTLDTTLAESGNHASEKEAGIYYYAIRINDTVGGYIKFSIKNEMIDGKQLTVVNEYFFAMISALGAEFNTEVTLNYHIDPTTGRFIYHDSVIDQGEIHKYSKIFIEGDKARFISDDSTGEEFCDLPAGVILENTYFFPHLKKDFIDSGLVEKTYHVYEVRENEVQETVYTLAGREKIELAGKEYDAFILDELNKKTGLKIKWWLDSETAALLKTQVPGNREVCLADESVIRNLELANLDESIMTRANVSIIDIQAISYMKVRAVIEPMGLWVTDEGLNVRGQRFEGTVDENLIEGIFEIEHVKYNGEEAPPFPPDFSENEKVAIYLERSDLAESDDPVLVEKARELTAGSKDSWEAAVRLSRWVADNISYAIPGGGSARRAYDSRAGECGAHSLLLASFCRGVGIPARVVWGCMYVPNFGGSFGQHAWTEIYMGKEAGWVPVDATAFEADFVDSGHIRIGEFRSATIALNAKSIEILEHRTGEEKVAGQQLDGKFDTFTGDYAGPEGMVFKVLVQNGTLGVDIPNQIVLLLHDPDEDGRRYAKLTNRLFITFDEDGEGKISAMILHELLQLPKRSEPDSTAGEIPQELAGYPGTYHMAQAKADFTVSIGEDKGLTVFSTIDNNNIRLVPLDQPGRFIDEFGKNKISFQKDGDGKVVRMEIEAINRFEKQ